MTTSPYTPSQVQRSSSDSAEHDAGSSASIRGAFGNRPATSIHSGIAPCSHDLDVIKRDRFELLSAYLDGEVTPEERQQVLCWLQHDQDTRCLYDRLLALRQGMRSQICPPSCNADATVTGVFHRLNHRLRLATMASVGVAAVSVLNLLSGGAGVGYNPWQAAMVSQPEALQVALDKPAFPIPEAVSSLESSDQSGIPTESEL